MKTIKMLLGGELIAEVVDGEFHCIMKSDHPFALNFKELYDACFYNMVGSSTFEGRFELAKYGHYFCYLKPSLKLIVEES